MSFKQILLKKGFFALMDKATVALIGFVYVVLSARIISTEEYGALMLALSIYNFLILYSDSGTGNALVKYAAEGREREKILGNAFRIKMLSLAAVSVLSMVFAFTLPEIFRTPQLFSLFLFIPVLMFSLVLNTFFKQLLQAEHRIKEIFYVDFTGLLTMSFLFFMAFEVRLLKGALDVLLILAITNLISAFLGFYLSKYMPAMEKDRKWSKKILRFSNYSSLSALGSIIYTRTDMIMLGLMLGAPAVAVYGSAWILASAVYIIPQAIYMVIFPMASKMSSERREREMPGLYWHGVAYSLSLSIPASLILIFFPYQVLSIVYGGRYMESAYVLQVLAFWGIIRPFGNLSGAFIDGMGKPRVNANIIWMTAGINVIANLILIPIYGVAGAAYASIIAFSVGAPVGMGYFFSRVREMNR